MSENESKIEKMEETLNDITECSICTETYKDPKILSCIHTFCKNCLEELASRLEKSVGDEVPCPICRKKFVIPEDGFDRLQKNFFMEKLIEMRNILHLDPSSRLDVCESCEVGEDQSSGENQPPVAEVFCEDCMQKLCKDCYKYHPKNKASKNHKIIHLNEQQVAKRMMSGYCGIHCMQPLDVYCASCKDTTCSICFFESHKSHEGSSVESVVNGFQNQIQDSIETLSEYIPILREKNEKLETEKAEFISMLSELEIEINRRSEELQTLIQTHTSSLLSEVNTQRQAGLKNMELLKDDIDNLLVSLESFNAYCNQVTTLGSATSICKAFGSLNDRTAELQDLCASQTENIFTFPRLQLTKRSKAGSRNLIGEIQENEENAKNTSDLDVEELEEMSVLVAKRIQKLKNVEQNLNKKVKDLEQQVSFLQYVADGGTRDITDSIDYKAISNPAIKFNSVSGSSYKWSVKGMAILENEFFVCVETSVQKMVVEIYDLRTLHFKSRWTNEKELSGNIKDVKGCRRNKCLYFMIESNYSIVFKRSDPNGVLITSWSLQVQVGYSGQIGQFSVTDEGNVLFTAWKKTQLEEYTPNGELLRIIELKWNDGFENLKYAIKLNSGYYLVSHGDDSDLLRRICLINTDGKVLNHFGEVGDNNQKDRLSCLVYMDKDSDDNVVVVDSGLCCLTALTPQLKHIKAYHFAPPPNSWETVIPKKVLIDECNKRVFTVEIPTSCHNSDRLSYLILRQK